MGSLWGVTSAKNGSYFIRKWFLLNSFEKMCRLEESYKLFSTFCFRYQWVLWNIWAGPLYESGRISLIYFYSIVFCFCISDINECLSNPCANGQCTQPLPNFYTCLCDSGWQGLNCDQGKFIGNSFSSNHPRVLGSC